MSHHLQAHHVDLVSPFGRTDVVVAESRLWTRSCLALLGLWLVVFSVFAHTYWVPANGAADQNAYLVAAKMFAAHGSPQLRPTAGGTGRFDPDQYVGPMWTGVGFGTADESYYPKYPFGTWAIQAAVLKIAGPTAVYWLSPASMVASMLCMYLLVRVFAGSLAALLGVVVFSLTGTVLALTNSPCSHAIDLFFVTAGMLNLVRWLQTRRAWQSVAAGLLLGFAATVRYIDGLLVLPMVGAAAIAMTGPVAGAARDVVRMARTQTILLLTSWALPLTVLVVFNIATLHSLTGYDATGESTGFSWQSFIAHWREYLWLLHSVALPYVFTLGLAGMLTMSAWNWRGALLLGLWAWPGLLGCMSFYFTPNTRFLLPWLPPFVLCAVWLVFRPLQLLETRLRSGGAPAIAAWGPRVASVGAMLGVIAFPLLVELPRQWSEVRKDQDEWLNLVEQARAVMAVAPPGSLIFARQPEPLNNLFNHLQYVGDYELHRLDSSVGNQPRSSLATPPWLSKDRVEAENSRVNALSEAQFQEARFRSILAAARDGRRSFVITTIAESEALRPLFGTHAYVVRPQGFHVDPHPTTGRLLRPEGWEQYRDMRMRWYLYEIVPLPEAAHNQCDPSRTP